MGGCYSTEKHDGPEYSSIFGPRAAKGEVQKSQVENIPPPVVSWENLHKYKQVLTFLDLYNSEDSKQRNKRVTNYYGDQYTELHEKSFAFELVGTPVLGSDKGELEFVFRLDPSAAGSPGLNNIHGNGKHMADSQTEFPVVNSDFEVRRPDIPALKTAIGFPTKGAGNTPLGVNLGSKHQFAHLPANIVAEAEEYQKNAEVQASAPGPSNNLENIAIDAYLENFTVAKFRENLQARYREVVSYGSDPARYTIATPSLPGIQFRDPLTVSTSLRFSDGSTAAPKFPAKLYPGLVSPPFLTAAVAIIANKQTLAAMFTSYSDWVGKQNKFPLFISGEWTSYPSDNRIGIAEDTKLPVLSLTGKGEYWTYFLESAYLRSLSDPRSLELKVQSLSHALKDIVGCPIQEVAFKAVGLTQEQLQLLLSEIQTYGYPAAFIKSGVWSENQQGELTQGVPWLVNEEIRISTPSADGQSQEAVFIGLSSPWRRKSSPTTFAKYQKNTDSILEHFRSQQTQPGFFSDVYLTPAEIYSAFDTYVVCHHTESFKFIPVKLDKPPSPYAFLEIDVTEPSRIYIMMSQPEHLLRHESITSAKNGAGDRLFSAATGKIALKGYNFMGFVLFKKDKLTKQVTLVENFGLSARDIWTKQDLTPGNYFLMTSVRRPGGIAYGNKVNISLYAAYYPGVYEISLNYFSRKLTSKEETDELAPLRLVAEALTEAGPLKSPEKWTRLGATTGPGNGKVLRQTNIGSNMVSTIWYHNNSSAAVNLEVLLTLGATCLHLDLDTQQLGKKGTATRVLLSIGAGEYKPVFLVHEDSEMRLAISERFLA